MDSKMIRKGAAGILATVLLCFTGVFASFASADTETAENAETQGPKVESSITSCLINPDKKSVTVKVTSSGDMTGTDGVLYLVEQKPYQKNLEGRLDYAGAASFGTEVTYQFPLNEGTAEDRLYSRFVVAVWDGTK